MERVTNWLVSSWNAPFRNEALFGASQHLLKKNSCASLPEGTAYREMCSNVFDEQKRFQFESQLTVCEEHRLWSAAGGKFSIVHERADKSRDTSTNEPWQSCVDVKSGWVVYRSPLLVSTGGYDWWHFNGERLDPRVELTQANHSHDGTTFAVHEYFLGTANNEGVILGYPPVHEHHFHIEDALTKSAYDEVVTHGDDECLLASGGTNCNIRRFPSGYLE